MARTRRNTGVRSTPGKEVEVVSDVREKLEIYCKPVYLYNILQKRLQNNPYFIPERLSYIIQAKKENKATSGVETTFNYMDGNNKKLETEVVKSFTCPFCSMKCGSFEGLKFHLSSSHDIFEYNFLRSENDHSEIDVRVKSDAFKFGELSFGLEKHQKIPHTFSRPKGVKRPENNNVISDILTITQPEIAQSSEPKVPRASSESKVPRASRKKKLSPERSEDRRSERLKNRQLYHSKTYQPMSLEQVTSGVDSETEDDDLADSEERMKLDRLVDVSEEDKRFMWLCNTFMRKQRVVADGHVSRACEEFIKVHVKELISPHAFSQWREFMVTLRNHGLVCAKTFDKCNTFLHKAQEAAAASSSTSQATTANGNEQQAPMELDAE